MRRSVLWGLLAWVAVIAVASAVTWAVIDQAGKQVLSDDAPVVTAPGSTASPAGPSGSVSTSPRPEPSPAQASAGTTSSPAAPGTERSIERRWQGAPGTLLVRCAGSAADLRSATPNDNYGVEVESRGPGEVEVKFEGAGGEVKVEAQCEGGVPRFRAEADSPGDREDEED